MNCPSILLIGLLWCFAAFHLILVAAHVYIAHLVMKKRKV